MRTTRKTTDGERRDQVEAVVALEPLLHDLHVQQAEKAAAKTEAQRDRAFGLVDERGIVELELFERVAQSVVLAFVRIEAAVDHRHRFAIAGQRDVRRVAGRGDRVADVDIAQRLDVGDDVADAAEIERLGGAHLRREDADLGAFEDALVRHRHEPRAGAQLPSTTRT